jgi:Mn2+/Fe2+ NRAMP family transporter
MLASQIWGIEPWIATVIQLVFLTGVMLLGVFRVVEFIGVALGSLQLVFIAVMFMIGPDWGEVWAGLWTFHWGEQNWEMLVAGNVGAVIMPWMLYYQQSAICTRKIKVKDMKYEKVDTLIGSILAQTVMLSMVIAMGAAQYLGKNADDRDYATVVGAFAPYLGSLTELVVSCGSLGACMVASIVLMITPAWSIAEIIGVERDMNKGIYNAPVFYLLQFLGLLICALTTIFSDFATTPAFAVFTEVTNGLLILPVATFLWLLASSPKVLPEKYRLQGLYKWILFVVFFVVCGYCVYGAFISVVLAWQDSN